MQYSQVSVQPQFIPMQAKVETTVMSGDSESVTCPKCNVRTKRFRVENQPSGRTYLMAVLCCCFCVLGTFLPFLCSCYYEANSYCPNCKTRVG